MAPGGKGQAQLSWRGDGTYSIRRTVAAPTTPAASGAATQSTGAKPTQQKAGSSERTVSVSDFVNHTTQLLDWASKELENARHLVEQREAAGKNRWDSTRELKELGLDAVQVALDAGGLIPGLGAYPDGVNTVISFLRENYGDAAWSAVSCIPWVGWFNGLGKTGIKGKEALELIAKAVKNDLVGKSADEVINAVGEAIEAGRKALEAAGERISTWADEAGEALGAKLDELGEALGMSSSPQPALATAGGTGGAGRVQNFNSSAGTSQRMADALPEGKSDPDVSVSSVVDEAKITNEMIMSANKLTSNFGRVIDITPSTHHTVVYRKAGLKNTKNSSVDILDEDGNIVTRRWYDSQGRAIRDVDMNHHGNVREHPECPHEHIWTWAGEQAYRSK